jgi:catechol 2,3-dioxygenase-like lactoylglutathione lyase family enzyme
MSIPGLRGVEHVGVTVPDIEQADRFLVDVIGCTHVYSTGPIAAPDSDRMKVQFNVDSSAVIREVRMYKLQTGANLEVFEYAEPTDRDPWPRSSEVGAFHLAVYVDDFDEALAFLRANHVRILGQPQSSSGPGTGQRWIYFLSPWGMQFELVSYPEGKAYSHGRGPLLWHPAHPAD